MPFKSIAQMDRCKQLVADGKMTQAQYDKSLAETDVDTLPERIHPKKGETEEPSRK